jgi:predicted PurR-regulated permease PerM
MDQNEGSPVKLHLPEDSPESATVDDATASAARSPGARARFTVAITPRSIWFAGGVVLMVLALVVLLTKALAALILVFISIILAEAIRPLVARLQRRRIPQPLAVLLIYLGVIVILAGFLWILLNPVVTQVSALASQSPTYVAHLQQWSTDVQHNLAKNPAASSAVRQLSGTLATLAQQALPSLISVSVGLLTGIFALFINGVIVLTLSLFWLGTSTRFKRFVVELFPPAKRELVAQVAAKMSKSLGGWVLGTLIAMLLIGSLTTLGLLIIGVPYALLLGILAGFTELIPYLGPWISGSVAVATTLITTGNLTQALGVVVLFLIIQEVEGNVIEPLVMHKAVQLDPWLVLVSLLIGGELLGLIGVILAVPVTAVLQVVTLEVIAPAIRLATNQPVATTQQG